MSWMKEAAKAAFFMRRIGFSGGNTKRTLVIQMRLKDRVRLLANGELNRIQVMQHVLGNNL